MWQCAMMRANWRSRCERPVVCLQYHYSVTTLTTMGNTRTCCHGQHMARSSVRTSGRLNCTQKCERDGSTSMTSLVVLIMISHVVKASDDITTVVKSNAITWLNTELQTSHRYRRDVDDIQKSQLIAIHNELRRKEQANNMELLVCYNA